jgi:hypothetical protein
MWRRRVVGTKDIGATGCLALSLAPHQHFDPAFESGNVIGLGRDDAAEIIDDPFEMGDFFFQMFHCRYMARCARPVKAVRRLAPSAPFR